jgi:hypothetical protein
MTLELILHADDYASAEAQLRDKPSINAPLDSKCTDAFLDVLRRKDPSIAHVPTDYSAPSADDRDPYQASTNAFTADQTKTKLFIPLVIEGYSSLHANEERTGLFQNAVYYVKMLVHFLCGGCIENHIVMLTVIKNNDGSYRLEYYDPKGRDVSDSQIIRYSQNNQNVVKVINTVARALGPKNVRLVFHNQGRWSANQSILNGIDCGYFVIRRCARISGLKNFGSTDIATIASRALTFIQDNPLKASEQTIYDELNSGDDF